MLWKGLAVIDGFVQVTLSVLSLLPSLRTRKETFSSSLQEQALLTKPQPLLLGLPPAHFLDISSCLGLVFRDTDLRQSDPLNCPEMFILSDS